MASADVILGETFREALRQRDRLRSLLCAEAPFDLQHQHYALSYFRIFDGHIPAERYADPFYPIMIAVTGFEDREMINRALLYRYILSYEPYNFKGDLRDFPLTVEYGKKSMRSGRAIPTTFGTLNSEIRSAPKSKANLVV